MVELIITVSLLAFLIISITLVYRTCFRAFNAGEDRAKIRTPLSQVVELMTRDIYKAQAITVCNATTLTFYADLGSGASTYSYSLSGNNLIGPTGVTKATGIQPQNTSVSWGTTPALFTCQNGTVTVDLTSVNNNETVHVKTDIVPRNLPLGVTGWWKFDEATSGTCSGASAKDSSGNGDTGTCNSSPTWVGGTIGTGALNFNGVGAYVAVSGNYPTSLNAPFTISLWVKPNSAAGTIGLIGSRSPSDASFDLKLQNGNQIHADIGTGSSWITTAADATFPYSTGTWYHIVYVVTTTGYSIYANGKLLATGSFASTTPLLYNSTHTLNVGYTSCCSEYFNGVIDDVRIYNRALNTSEVQQLYQGN